MRVNLNKIEHMSSVDYPDKMACVVFFNGCPWRCGYCHNKQTWTEVNMVDVEYIKEQIKSCLPFVSAVVFSGGEPTYQIKQLLELCKFSKENGFNVGIETNGYNTKGIIKLKPYVDLFMVDIKAPIDNDDLYYKATHSYSASNIRASLKLDIPIEIRIVDTGNAKEIADCIKTKHKITILPYIKRN